MYQYAAHLIDVIDADTLRLKLDLGFSVFVQIPCRLARVNAPELGTLPGAIAKGFVVDTLSKAINLTANTAKPDKYGRWLVELTFETQDKPGSAINLSDLLLSTSNAAPYK
jgi:endonuclease YncB( thermonuclease family)